MNYSIRPVERICSNTYIARIMLSRLFAAFLAIFAWGSLADPTAAKPYPSLAKRPTESLDRSPKLQEVAAPLPVDPQLAAQVDTLSKQAESGDAAFRQQLEPGRKAVAAANGTAPSSEAWVDAQVAISALDTARYDSVAALAGLDSLYVDRQDNADVSRIGVVLVVIDPVRTRALAKVDAQNDVLDSLRTTLRQP